ncbi:hypothetical protein BU17DRAFT_61031 [Hysterangium stoloniferum]|nr:hypothetical protein BU17DRAFT_61031 [Hysterangium stoloniferum]
MNSYNPVPLPHTLDSEHKGQRNSSQKSRNEVLASQRLQHRGKRGLHPLSLIVLGIWTSYIAATIVLLEKAAAAAPRSVDQPWIFDVLPGIMLTFFPQAHISVTALHLSRVGVSAIQQESTAPHSWAELFCWLTTHGLVPSDSQGPSGVTINTTITPNTFSPNAITNMTLFYKWGQALAHGPPVYPIFTPEGSSREVSNDFFCAGNILDAITTLPGLRIQGGCEPFSNEASIAIEQNITLFSEFCANSFSPFMLSNQNVRNVSILPENVTITFGYCTNAGTNNLIPPVSKIPDLNSTAYIFLQTDNGTIYTPGMIKCQSVLSFGSASLSGTQGIYKSFRNQLGYNDSSTQRGQIMDPLGTTLSGLGGYNAIAIAGHLNYTQPSLDIFADRIWLGVAHMVAGLGLLFRTSDTAYPAVVRLGSYVAARLHAEDTRLYAGDEPVWDSRSHSGELSGDERLNRPFVSEARLGDDSDGM